MGSPQALGDPAPLARSSQSLKEETCLVPVYSHKVGQRVGLIARSAHVDARTVRVLLTHMLAVWSNEPKQLSLSQHRNVQTKNTNTLGGRGFGLATCHPKHSTSTKQKTKLQQE